MIKDWDGPEDGPTDAWLNNRPAIGQWTADKVAQFNKNRKQENVDKFGKINRKKTTSKLTALRGMSKQQRKDTWRDEHQNSMGTNNE